jgi:hypothetical protein
MEDKDVAVGMKVVPFQKTIFGPLNFSIVWKVAQNLYKPSLFVIKKNDDFDCWILGMSMSSNGDFFKAVDFEPYTE